MLPEGEKIVVAAFTPSGKRIIKCQNGKYKVQPKHDDRWIECETIGEAFEVHFNPEKFENKKK